MGVRGGGRSEVSNLTPVPTAPYLALTPDSHLAVLHFTSVTRPPSELRQIVTNWAGPLNAL